MGVNTLKINFLLSNKLIIFVITKQLNYVIEIIRFLGRKTSTNKGSS